MSRLHKLERRIDQKLREVLRSSSPDDAPEPLEVRRALLDEIASRTDTLARGKLSFGYSQVNVRVLLPEPERRRSYELMFLEANSLTRDIKSDFEERKVEFPGRLKVEVELVDSLPVGVSDRGFDVSYSNPLSSPLSLNTIPIWLTVLIGNAEKNQYCFTKQRINLGRMAEVLDSDLRAVRRNDLPLNDDSTAANSTVSRAHAHLEFHPDESRFRLFDDGSAHGTTVVRDGSVILVPHGTSKGVLLQPGDEIILGKVRIRFEYADTE
jgi:FHA domain